MPSQEDIDDQLKLLEISRRNLAHYLQQRETLGEAYTPPGTLNGILDTRANIQRIKGILSGWNVPANEHPDDEETEQAAGERRARHAGQHLGAGDLNQGVPTPSTAQPTSVLPYPPNRVFVGRYAELARLAEWLARPHAVVAIAGLGGVGKTQLATEFAHQCADDRAAWPGGVFWVPMSSPAGVGTVVAGSGRALGIAGYDALPFPEQIEVTRRAWAGPEPRLLVFDNCEDPALLKQWRPTTGGARVLLTSRRATWPPALAQTLPLGQLPRAAALELLLSGRAAVLGMPADRLAADPAASAICEQLGDLALAIHMAAAYLAERPVMPLAGFLAELRAQSIDHAALQALDQDSPTEHIQHIAQTIELSYRLLEDDEGRKTDDEGRRTKDEGRTIDDNATLSPQSSQPSVLSPQSSELAGSAHPRPGGALRARRADPAGIASPHREKP